MFNINEVVCLVGPKTIVSLKINRYGTIDKESLSKRTLEKERIVKISNSRWLKRGALLLTDSTDETYIPDYACVSVDCKVLQLTDPRTLKKDFFPELKGLSLKAYKDGKTFVLIPSLVD